MRSVGHPSAWKQWVWNTRCYQTKTILTMIDFTDPQPSPSFWKLGWQYLNRVAHTAVTVSITVSPLTLQISIRTDPVWLIFPTDSRRFSQILYDWQKQWKPLVVLLQYGLTKTKINPLRLMQVSYETWMAQPSGNPWASSDIFSLQHHHPTGFASTARR